MQRSHLERLGLVCPTCRAAGRDAPRLVLAHVERADGDELIEAVLHCPATLCRREHPIIDGIVIALAEMATWVGHQLEPLMRRDDLSPWMTTLLGDAAGRGVSLDRERHDLSAYAGAHWGDRDLAGRLPDNGTLPPLIAGALETLPSPGTTGGMWLDLGCSVGRATFELARAGADFVVGVDLNFSMLRRAEQARRTGRIAWPQRRVGLVFDPREATLDGLPREPVAFLCADACALPFADGAAAGALSLNVLDCVPSPLAHLIELGRVLAPGAPAALTTPYDWSATATAAEHWLGGHSQRDAFEGRSELILRKVLSPAAEAGVDTKLIIVEERDRVPWALRLNDRSTMHYQVHLLRLARKS